MLELRIAIQMRGGLLGLAQRLVPVAERMQEMGPTVGELTRQPCAVNAAANFARLLHVHRSGNIGSPRVSTPPTSVEAAMWAKRRFEHVPLDVSEVHAVEYDGHRNFVYWIRWPMSNLNVASRATGRP
jgi:hypothetical protein